MLKEFVSLIMARLEIGKRPIFNHHSKWSKKKNCIMKNMNLIDSNYHWKNWVDWISAREGISCNIKNVHFEKKGPKVKKHKILKFHNFVLKPKTGWATTVLKPILETRNVNDVYVYVWCTFLNTNSFLWLLYSCLKNEWFLNFSLVLFIQTLRKGQGLLWPWGIPLSIKLTFFEENFVTTCWNRLITLHGELKCVF